MGASAWTCPTGSESEPSTTPEPGTTCRAKPNRLSDRPGPFQVPTLKVLSGEMFVDLSSSNIFWMNTCMYIDLSNIYSDEPWRYYSVNNPLLRPFADGVSCVVVTAAGTMTQITAIVTLSLGLIVVCMFEGVGVVVCITRTGVITVSLGVTSGVTVVMAAFVVVVVVELEVDFAAVPVVICWCSACCFFWVFDVLL